jgi:hypothetical protein
VISPMDSQLLLSRAVFNCRRAWLAYQLPIALAAVAMLSLAGAFAFHAAGQGEILAARREASGLGEKTSLTVAPGTMGARTKVDLKVFRSSHLLTILEQGASTANLRLDEISFAVDDSPNQPYVRYRATFTVVSRYSTIRKFISEILAGSEGVVLDTVACRREDVTAADVRCDISAYVAYQEEAGD